MVDMRNDDRATYGIAEIVIPERRTRKTVCVIEKIIGIQLVIPEELVGIAVKVVSPAASDGCDLATSIPAGLSRIGIANHLDLLDRIDTGVLLNGDVGATVEQIGPIERPVVLALPQAIDRNADDVVATCWVGGAQVN